MKHTCVTKILCLFTFAAACLLSVSLQAQEHSVLVKGIVKNQFGVPLSGVLVNSGNGKNGSSSGIDGTYSLTIDDHSTSVVFSKRGFLTRKFDVNGNQSIDVSLQRDVHGKDEIVQLGYTSQRRKEISGAVSATTGAELERAPVANLTQSFAGRLSGLTTVETFSELSRATTNLYIRGLSSYRNIHPLVMVDGIMVAYNPSQTLDYISADEIASVSVLKDASTEALYGIQGANGVIVITTKRGTKGKLQVHTRYDQSVQQPTNVPTYYHSWEYAEMRNQAGYNDDPSKGANQYFTDAQVDAFRSGSNRELYPDNNWYNMFMRKLATMERVGIDLNGGNDNVQFYSNLNVMHQSGLFKTDQTAYNPNSNDVWINYRSNVDVKINKYIKAYVRLSGNIKRERTPGSANQTVYTSLFEMPSSTYGPVTPELTDADGNVILEGGQVVTTDQLTSPAYGMLNRTGYIRHTVTNITSQFGMDIDLGFLTKGLSVNGVFAYQTNSVGSLTTKQDYERYERTDDLDTLGFVKKGSQQNSPLSYTKASSFYYHITSNVALNYNRRFNKHEVGAMAYMFYQNLTKADNSSPGLLPYNRVSSGVEATYGYNDRYFVKFDMGYSGSEQYARSHRYVATPAVSAAWVASDESFLKSASWLSNLKLRASYGKTANDQSGLARYAYLDNVTVTGGGPLGYLQYLVTEKAKGNPDIEAEISTKENVGIDLGLFNALSVSVDVFHEKMNNMVVNAASTIPTYQGIPLDDYPSTNTGVFENQGYEVSVNYDRVLNKDLSFSVGGMVSYAKNKLIYEGEALKTEDYAYRKWQEGYSYGQDFGYRVDYSKGNGYFNTQADLDNGPTYAIGTPRLGDLMYQDLNKDGQIDEKDKAPVGTGAIPRIVYAISGGVTYKNFTLNILFQGVGQYQTLIGGMGVWETYYNGVYGALQRNAWTAERYANGEKITAPALAVTTSTSEQSSDFILYNRSYLRLKNVELSYNLPSRLTRLISANQVQFVLSGQNLVTWDHMKSDDFGPEGGSYGQFPVYRVYNAGLSVTF